MKTFSGLVKRYPQIESTAKKVLFSKRLTFSFSLPSLPAVVAIVFLLFLPLLLLLASLLGIISTQDINGFFSKHFLFLLSVKESAHSAISNGFWGNMGLINLPQDIRGGADVPLGSERFFRGFLDFNGILESLLSGGTSLRDPTLGAVFENLFFEGIRVPGQAYDSLWHHFALFESIRGEVLTTIKHCQAALFLALAVWALSKLISSQSEGGAPYLLLLELFTRALFLFYPYKFIKLRHLYSTYLLCSVERFFWLKDQDLLGYPSLIVDGPTKSFLAQRDFDLFLVLSETDLRTRLGDDNPIMYLFLLLLLVNLWFLYKKGVKLYLDLSKRQKKI